MRRVAFFVNPVLAARGSRRTALEHCAGLLRANGCSVDLIETLPQGGTSPLARNAAVSGCDTVFACGGDGTLFQVLQGMAGTEIALGMIPMGTGNILAQNLRLPHSPIAAMRAQMKSEPVSIPLGEASCVDANGVERTWYFMMAAGVGFHSALMGLSQTGAGKRRFGRGAYYLGALRLLATRAPQSFDVELKRADGESRRFRASELIAVRVPKINVWRAGGDLRSTHLQVASICETGRGGLAHACVHAFLRPKNERTTSRLGLPYPRFQHATEVVCEAAFGSMPVQADGEVIGAGRVTIRMADKRVRLLWPGRGPE